MFDRRRLLQASGLAAGTLYLPSLLGDRRAYAQVPPQRLVVITTEHGPVNYAGNARRWQMRKPGLPTTEVDWEFSLDDLPQSMWSEALSPLYAVRKDVIITEGLAMTSAYGPGFGGNGHGSSTGNRLACHGGGGGPSFDQVVGDAIRVPGRLPPLLFSNYDSNSPFSSYCSFDTAGKMLIPANLGNGGFGAQYDRIFGGTAIPAGTSAPAPTTSPAELSRRRRQSTLDIVKGEYTKVLARLSADDRDKLTRHRDMVADLERQISGLAQIKCEKPARPGSTRDRELIARIALTSLIPVAMSCDLTRTVTMALIELGGSQIGITDPKIEVHAGAAHVSKTDPGSTWMTNYYKLHAQQFADTVAAFKSVPEGNGTMLDNTLIVWVPELANGVHDLYNMMIVMAGGAGHRFRTGRYLKYEQHGVGVTTGYDIRNPDGSPGMGPPHSKLYVAIMQAFGVNRSSIGVTSLPGRNGSTIDLTGPLGRLT
jgi:hypothetical protein